MKIVLLEGLGVSEDVLQSYADRLREMGHTFEAYDKNADPAVQTSRCAGADAVMLANMPLAKEVIEQTETLKYIDVAFTGVDHIPMKEAKEHGIAVSNASGYATQAVAELTLGMMIQLLRNVDLVQERCREGKTKDGLVGNLLCGKTVGIIGAGAIGKRTAALCKAFGCSVIAYSRSKVCDPSIDEQVTLEELLRRADVVSLHVPLTDATRGMIGKTEIGTMKDSAILINMARGPVVDSNALADALNSGKLAGAGIDVFETEPPLDTAHPLLHTPNTVVTPHIGFASVESMQQRAQIVFDNLFAWLNGEVRNQVG